VTSKALAIFFAASSEGTASLLLDYTLFGVEVI